MKEKRGMNDKGQFYIMAAIIIIGILIGIFVYGNYAKPKKEITKIYDLGEELDLETGSVYDYGTYSEEVTDTLIRNWTEIYYVYSQNVIENWIFLYGNKERMTALYFTTQSSGSVCIGGQTCIETTRTVPGQQEIDSPGKEVAIVFQNSTYNFELKEAENFFFVIRAGGYSAGT